VDGGQYQTLEQVGDTQHSEYGAFGSSPPVAEKCERTECRAGRLRSYHFRWPAESSGSEFGSGGVDAEETDRFVGEIRADRIGGQVGHSAEYVAEDAVWVGRAGQETFVVQMKQVSGAEDVNAAAVIGDYLEVAHTPIVGGEYREDGIAHLGNILYGIGPECARQSIQTDMQLLQTLNRIFVREIRFARELQIACDIVTLADECTRRFGIESVPIRTLHCRPHPPLERYFFHRLGGSFLLERALILRKWYCYCRRDRPHHPHHALAQKQSAIHLISPLLRTFG